MGLYNLPPKSKCLLGIDTSVLLDNKIKSQQYWLYMVKATRITGERALKLLSGKTASWKDIMTNGRFISPPTHNPPVDATSPATTVNKLPTKAKQ